MGVILCWSIKGNLIKLFRDDPEIPTKISSTAKSQDKIGWDNIIRGQIERNWNKWQSEYIK